MKKNIYVFNEGEFKRKDNTIYFETEKGKKYLPIEDINDILIFGEVTLNKRFLEFMTDKKICLHFFNTMYGYYKGTYYPREHLNSGYMILKQAEFYMDENKRFEIAKAFVEGSYRNISQVLNYYYKREKNVGDILENIINLSTKIEGCNDISELMGIEGNIRDTYYKAFDVIIEKPDFIFEGRSKRPPKNELNTLISFGNSLLYVQVLSEIYKTHLDPRIGYLHTTNFRRFTLNLDIAEIFKPIIVDRIIFNLLGKKMITKKDFEKDMGGILLKEKGRKTFVQEFDEKLKTTITHRGLGRKVSYQRLIRMELYKLQKHLMEEEKYIPYVSRW
ncbi:type I-B CRISPR-associated endonuclease Cas1b [Paramaledivibacter caminithermalis]|uniref:CRISPR-associated endonuclease Cas1 n=1 Tax=Paramaledivibacter caminithermalis (strain DSM 15212 / CIP 107654 / DViRD3) TaxID=1121301 RepID=A0A1M6KPP0_PARC5|nr:type I-B CRISPR-associated endonuclease Cas1b [Paramaledivibacter caminithermalis]SHJ60917.1 CRISP-associated protein Cas1 [Paramaledivibacter caminithermalis DSM 15212]